VGLGFLGGFIRGLIVGGFFLAFVSVYFTERLGPSPELNIVEVPTSLNSVLKSEDSFVQRPKFIDQTTTEPAPEVTAPSVETSLNDPEGMKDAPNVPETLIGTTSLKSPELGLDGLEALESSVQTTITTLQPSRPRTEENSAARTQLEIEHEEVNEALVPNTGLDQITLPNEPTAPELRRSEQTPPSEEVNDVVLPTDKTDETKLGLVMVDAIETPAAYGKAIDLYARDNISDEGKPKLSIVLLTDQLNAIDPNLLQALPIPVTFAVDPMNPAADTLLISLRQRQQEAVIIADLPPKAAVQDVDVALTALVNLLPQTVGVIERQAGALQQSRNVMLQVPEVLNRTGHGLVVYEKGLNTLAKEAGKAGTPVATIYRDLDGADQNERTIRRFLDGAAFRAANSPSEPIVVLARLRPETMSAILIWALQDRAQKTAIVPVSQLMKAGLQN
jgi:polysaccharide deacetylase 2 family uncharacterized protein YibQ